MTKIEILSTTQLFVPHTIYRKYKNSFLYIKNRIRSKIIQYKTEQHYIKNYSI